MDDREEGRKSLSKGQRFLLWAINLFPLTLRIWVFENLALLLYFIDGKHRRICQRNLHLAFPEFQADQIVTLSRKVFRNLGRVFAEFTFIPRLHPGNIGRYITAEGMEHYDQARRKGKGVLVLTAHFGNWEWLAAAFPILFGHGGYVVVRPLDNRFLNRLVEALRTWTGNRTVPKQKSMGQLLRLLKRGQTLGILLDQNVSWQEGIFVPFFGELACTNIGLALLAMKTEAPVIPFFSIRQADGTYRIIIEPEIPLIRTGNKEWDIEQNTLNYTAMIERYVRNCPDHWFWVHQRWKTRPWQAKRARGVAV